MMNFNYTLSLFKKKLNLTNQTRNYKTKLFKIKAKSFSSSIHVDKHDDTFFKSIKDWWDVNGTMRTLHSYNDLRIKYLKQQIQKEGITSPANKSLPFNNLLILDVGCGGGIFCESLARLGGQVTGIDSNENSYNISTTHLNNYEGDDLNKMRSKLKYYLGSSDNYIEDTSKSDRLIKSFDIVSAMEVIEHVNSPTIFVKDLATLNKDGGYVIISTINKTTLSYYGMIVAGEKLFSIVPEGTHDWNKFIKPDNLIQILKENGYCLKDLSGVSYNPITGSMNLSKDLSMNYILFAKKSTK